MYNFTALVFVIAICYSATAQSKVVARISNLKNDNGVCRACLFSSASSFSSLSQAGNCVIASVKNKLATAIFQAVPPGCYAVFVFHDANNNSKIDKNIFGIPKEGYGASNNKLPFASAPHFEDNKFTVQENNIVALSIHLRNVF